MSMRRRLASRDLAGLHGGCGQKKRDVSGSNERRDVSEDFSCSLQKQTKQELSKEGMSAKMIYVQREAQAQTLSARTERGETCAQCSPHVTTNNPLARLR